MLALKKVLEPDFKGFDAVNMGTGTPSSVLDVIKTFEAVSGMDVPYFYGEKAKADLPETYSDTNKAAELLGFKAKRNLHDMVEDTLRFEGVVE
ncbi:MAG: hypothetical protein LBQ41_03495 [Candidatus Ancillula sp.]|nr:hypothetical protein [Candidatus Ancillula sp.]